MLTTPYLLARSGFSLTFTLNTPTKEGYSFWSDKQNEWYDYYDRIKKLNINELKNTYNYGRMFVRNY